MAAATLTVSVLQVISNCEHCQEKVVTSHAVVTAQLVNIESQQVADPPAADVSNQDDMAILEEEIHKLQHVVRCFSQR